MRAGAWAAKQAPRAVSFKTEVTFVPTAELAGPGWDATIGQRGGNIYGAWYGFDSTRAHVSPYTQYQLRGIALVSMRDAVIGTGGAIGPRLSNDVWLDLGWTLAVTNLDYTAVLRQSCAGIPIPTLLQLAAGPPALGLPGVPAETFARTIEEARATSPDVTGSGYYALMQLGEFVPSRVVEAVVHGMDLTDALGQDPIATPEGVAMTAAIFDELIARRTVPGRPAGLSDDLAWVRAASGRAPHADPRLPLIG